MAPRRGASRWILARLVGRVVFSRGLAINGLALSVLPLSVTTHRMRVGVLVERQLDLARTASARRSVHGQEHVTPGQFLHYALLLEMAVRLHKT